MTRRRFWTVFTSMMQILVAVAVVAGASLLIYTFASMRMRQRDDRRR